jgi:hypothetical protein
MDRDPALRVIDLIEKALAEMAPETMRQAADEGLTKHIARARELIARDADTPDGTDFPLIMKGLREAMESWRQELIQSGKIPPRS